MKLLVTFVVLLVAQTSRGQAAPAEVTEVKLAYFIAALNMTLLNTARFAIMDVDAVTYKAHLFSTSSYPKLEKSIHTMLETVEEDAKKRSGELSESYNATMRNMTKLADNMLHDMRLVRNSTLLEIQKISEEFASTLKENLGVMDQVAEYLENCEALENCRARAELKVQKASDSISYSGYLTVGRIRDKLANSETD
ncbi:uncharacterized protein LOC118439457 [Folsomia candida]|nr:uncharacterized protein LOC118439457 [Folsomia candida]